VSARSLDDLASDVRYASVDPTEALAAE